MTVKDITKQLNDDNLDDEAETIVTDTVYKALRRGSKQAIPKFKQEGSDRWMNAG